MKKSINNLTEAEVAEDIKRRYESETWQPRTKEEKKISDERIKKANEYAKKIREHQEVNY